MFSRSFRWLFLAVVLAGCSTPAITAPQILPPPPRLSEADKDALRACCTVVMPDGTRKVKPGDEIVWEVLAHYADYFNIINVSRALVAGQ